MRQVIHALLTRPPLSHFQKQAFKSASFDLHVLSTPPAFILSQDQTLMFKFVRFKISLAILSACESLHFTVFVVYLLYKIACYLILKIRFVVSFMRPMKIFYRNFQGCFTVQLSMFFVLIFVVCCLSFYRVSNIYINTFQLVCQQLFLFFLKVFVDKLLNGEGGI